MKFLGGILLLAGYMLVYSATAKGGVFASDPWTSLYADAYETFGDFIGSQVTSVGNTVGGAISGVGNRVGSRGTPGGIPHQTAPVGGMIAPGHPRFGLGPKDLSTGGRVPIIP